MTGRRSDSSESIPSHLVDGAVRVDDEGYLHTGRSQRLPDRVVVSCSRGGDR